MNSLYLRIRLPSAGEVENSAHQKVLLVEGVIPTIGKIFATEPDCFNQCGFFVPVLGHEGAQPDHGEGVDVQSCGAAQGREVNVLEQGLKPMATCESNSPPCPHNSEHREQNRAAARKDVQGPVFRRRRRIATKPTRNNMATSKEVRSLRDSRYQARPARFCSFNSTRRPRPNLIAIVELPQGEEGGVCQEEAKPIGSSQSFSSPLFIMTIITENPRAIVLLGGPDHVIQVDGKRHKFEMHPYCGPSILNHKGEPLKKQPERFLYAASQWAMQGRKVEDGLCVWFHDPVSITKHLGGRRYEWIRYEHPVRGE